MQAPTCTWNWGELATMGCCCLLLSAAEQAREESGLLEIVQENFCLLAIVQSGDLSAGLQCRNLEMTNLKACVAGRGSRPAALLNAAIRQQPSFIRPVEVRNPAALRCQQLRRARRAVYV